ncbi:MAG: hypothetical protein QOK10_1305 [Pseudonocardiales bacterium]|jgi:hypothetical protein|nr:hypothetical protein [Pseudonocardiales bacterium]
MAQTPSDDPVVTADAESMPQVEQSPSLSRSRPSGYPPDEVLPSRSSDEQDLGWGDEESAYGDDWYSSERPPHHG